MKEQKTPITNELEIIKGFIKLSLNHIKTIAIEEKYYSKDIVDDKLSTIEYICESIIENIDSLDSSLLDFKAIHDNYKMIY